MAIIAARSGLNTVLLSGQRILAIFIALGCSGFYTMADDTLQWSAGALLASAALYYFLLVNPLLHMLASLASTLTITGTVMVIGHFSALYQMGNANPDTFPLPDKQWIGYTLLFVVSLFTEQTLTYLKKRYEPQPDLQS